MKKSLTCAVILLLIGIATANWSGFYGVVTHGGVPVSGAWVLAVNTQTAARCSTQTIDDGTYDLECFEGYYDMKAWKGLASQTKLNQHCTGDPGGVEVNFQLPDDPGE